MTELHLAEVVVAFGDLKKGTKFDFDPDLDLGLRPYFEVGMLVDLGPDFYEQDQPVADVEAAFQAGEKKTTKAPVVKE